MEADKPSGGWAEILAGIPRTKLDWTLRAAREIEDILGKAVMENTKAEYGYFGGVSTLDVADIIRKHHAALTPDIHEIWKEPSCEPIS